ncbi:hypothetical protein NHF50_11605 [Flavobacterium sp. NRK F10]|uniref:Uncharacterized protein n=1 Tax=Flavobacterium sediminis TaxID=2201181 RepID=A0A2U8QW80_9FLAO|nr:MULTISPECIES: hypothetical protein [Flavobacterium]AWM14457.1 hypothetical protein DI487_11725 [Flavobacterium sediminis]MCO6175687.1 hypothetical protein [Flavobacterium sp. NRK F10]
MEIKLKFGFDELLFGMKQNHVETLYGKADFQYKDEEQNVILGYNDLKSRLTFYEEEGFRLGYITISNPEAVLFGEKVMGKSREEVLQVLKANKITQWETEVNDGVTMLFNEENWVFLHFDYGVLVTIEIGAVFTQKDEFDWKFKA